MRNALVLSLALVLAGTLTASCEDAKDSLSAEEQSRRPSPHGTSPGSSAAPASGPEPRPTGPPSRTRTPPDATASAPAPDGPCGTGAKLVPECGAWWGVYVRRGWEDSSVTSLESRVGRKFDIVMRYFDWTNSDTGRFPDASARRIGRSRHIFFSWDTRVYKTGETIKWASIARGDHDDEIVRPAAERMKAFGRPAFLSFDHEMELNVTPDGGRHGTEADYVAAARHVREVFDEVGATNVVWVFTLSGGVYGRMAERMTRLYPGDDHVDWVGWDPYNFHRCHRTGWETFGESIDRTYTWISRGIGRNKPLILPEYGTAWDPGDPGRAQRWHDDIPTTLATKYPRIKALIRWDSDVRNQGMQCGLNIDSGPGMLESFRRAGLHPYVNP
ncbi:hypothetical protein ABGB12_04350 [Actinocorallia sp. B10E7]|uniref:glycoside hydrolase family 26 protein n=1 Tax=Actinocorallia sp. B10E7 TaxID=3153558 RepID=UPI00325D142B